MPRLRRIPRLIVLVTFGTFAGCTSNTPSAPTTSETKTTTAAVDGASTGPRLDSSIVEFEGPISATNAVSRVLTVSGIDVSVPTGAVIRHGDRPLQFADLHVGDRVEIHATRSGTTLTATIVNDETEAAEPDEPDNDDLPGHDANEGPDHDAHEGPNHDGNEGPGHDGTNDSGHDGSGHDGHGGSGRH